MNTENREKKPILTTELIIELIYSITEIILAVLIITTDRKWIFPYLFVVLIERALRGIAKAIKEANETYEE